MVNASTPSSYVPVLPPQLEVQAEILETQSGYIASGTYYLVLETTNGIKLEGTNDTTNLQLYGVNDTSTNDQDVKVFVRCVRSTSTRRL